MATLKTYRKIEYTLVREKAPEPYNRQLTRPIEIFSLLKEFCNADREKFIVLFMDRRNQLIALDVAFVGTQGESLIDPGLVFRGAILLGASSIIVAHNHPSGDPEPSRQDIEMTEALVGAGKLLGIAVFDHMILGEDKFYSFAEHGLMPEVE